MTLKYNHLKIFIRGNSFSLLQSLLKYETKLQTLSLNSAKSASFRAFCNHEISIKGISTKLFLCLTLGCIQIRTQLASGKDRS